MQTDREAFWEFARGAIVPTVVLVLFFTFILTLGEPEERARPEERFKVVDTYGPCEVVRYTPKGDARFAYFLDCK